MGILFLHRAFLPCNLTSPEDIEKLDIPHGQNELPIPIRKDLQEVYIFCKALKSPFGYEMAPKRPITYGMMSKWVRDSGKILGLEYTVIPYSLRYNTGNKLDQDRSLPLCPIGRILADTMYSQYQRFTSKPVSWARQFYSFPETLPFS